MALVPQDLKSPKTPGSAPSPLKSPAKRFRNGRGGKAWDGDGVGHTISNAEMLLAEREEEIEDLKRQLASETRR